MRISDWSSDVCSSDLPEFGAVGVAFTAILDGERTRADGRKSTGHVDLRRHAAGDTHATQRTHVPVRVRDRTAVAEIATRFRAGAREQVDGIQETAPRGTCAIAAGGRDHGGQEHRRTGDRGGRNHPLRRGQDDVPALLVHEKLRVVLETEGLFARRGGAPERNGQCLQVRAAYDRGVLVPDAVDSLTRWGLVAGPVAD